MGGKRENGNTSYGRPTRNKRTGEAKFDINRSYVAMRHLKGRSRAECTIFILMPFTEAFKRVLVEAFVSSEYVCVCLFMLVTVACSVSLAVFLGQTFHAARRCAGCISISTKRSKVCF